MGSAEQQRDEIEDDADLGADDEERRDEASEGGGEVLQKKVPVEDEGDHGQKPMGP